MVRIKRKNGITTFTNGNQGLNTIADMFRLKAEDFQIPLVVKANCNGYDIVLYCGGIKSSMDFEFGDIGSLNLKNSLDLLALITISLENFEIKVRSEDFEANVIF